MSKSIELSPEILKQAVFELVAECRQRLLAGEVNVSEVERGVRAYCEAVAHLPAEEGRLHAKDLESLMREVTALGDSLVAAHDVVRKELEALARLKQANVAYQKSDAIEDEKPREASKP